AVAGRMRLAAHRLLVRRHFEELCERGDQRVAVGQALRGDGLIVRRVVLPEDFAFAVALRDATAVALRDEDAAARQQLHVVGAAQILDFPAHLAVGAELPHAAPFFTIELGDDGQAAQRLFVLDLGDVDFGLVRLPPGVPRIAALAALFFLTTAERRGRQLVAGQAAQDFLGLPRQR